MKLKGGHQLSSTLLLKLFFFCDLFGLDDVYFKESNNWFERVLLFLFIARKCFYNLERFSGHVWLHVFGWCVSSKRLERNAKERKFSTTANDQKAFYHESPTYYLGKLGSCQCNESS